MFGAQASPRLDPPSGPPVVYQPSNTFIQASDYTGTLTRDSTKLRITRAIDTSPQGDTSVFKATVPGGRFRFGVRSTVASLTTITLNYTGLVQRNDTYNPIGSVYIDGVFVADFTNSTAWSPGSPHPINAVSVGVIVVAGDHTVEIMLPYDASVDMGTVSLASTQTLIAPSARTTQKCVFMLDSIAQGFNSSRIRNHFTTIICTNKDWQQINLGYGGRQIIPSDFTVAGSVGAQRCLSTGGINNVIGGDSPASIKALYKTSISNYRSAATTAGVPTSRLYIGVPFYTEYAPLPGATLSDKLATVAAARQAIRDAITEMADPYVTLIESASSPFPTTVSGLDADKLHVIDSGSEVIAAAFTAVMS